MAAKIANELKNGEVDDLLKAILEIYGYDFSNYARASLKRRISRFMLYKNITSIKDLKEYLCSDESLFAGFLEELTVNVTEMFRDPSLYKAVREQVIPQLATYPHIKVWAAGCSTGEEVYSLAILFIEEGDYQKTKIYATDINQRDLAKAKEGIFPLAAMKEYTSNYISGGGKQAFSNYYTAKYNGAIFSQSIKDNIIFAVHNLVSDSSFHEFNMIVCRNVLIYFNKELQNHVIKLFYNSLCMFGYLILGSKESLLFSEYQDHFEVINKEEKIFRKIK